MLEIYFDGILIDADHYQSLSEKWVMFDKSFKLGSTLAREFTLVVPKSVFPVDTSEVLIKYMGANYAHLIVDNYKFSEGGVLPTVTLTLVDRMVLANFDYDYSHLTPCTTKTILLDICSEMGVELGNTGFINDDIVVDYWDNRVTARTYLGYIAELNGGFARIEKDGKLWLRSFKELTPQAINPELCENIIIGTPHKVDRVVFDNGLLIYSTSNDLELETLYLDGQNVFINDEATFNKIVPRIKDFEYYNINTGSTYVLPTVMVGDVLTLTLDGVTYPTIAQFNEISFMGLWHGAYELNLESQTQQETQVVSTEEKLKRINVIVDRNNNELTLEVSAIKDKVDDFQVGGRNLLLKSDEPFSLQDVRWYDLQEKKWSDL